MLTFFLLAMEEHNSITLFSESFQDVVTFLIGLVMSHQEGFLFIGYVSLFVLDWYLSVSRSF